MIDLTKKWKFRKADNEVESITPLFDKHLLVIYKWKENQKYFILLCGDGRRYKDQESDFDLIPHVERRYEYRLFFSSVRAKDGIWISDLVHDTPPSDTQHGQLGLIGFVFDNNVLVDTFVHKPIG